MPKINNMSARPHASTGSARRPIPSPAGRGEKYGGDGSIGWTRVSRMYETAWCDEDSMPVGAAIWSTRYVKDGFVSASRAPSRDKEYLCVGGVKSHKLVRIEATQ